MVVDRRFYMRRARLIDVHGVVVFSRLLLFSVSYVTCVHLFYFSLPLAYFLLSILLLLLLLLLLFILIRPRSSTIIIIAMSFNQLLNTFLPSLPAFLYT